MVTCSIEIGDGGGWKGELAPTEQPMKSSSRPLVYDVETGSLRFSKSRPLKSPDPNFTPTSSFTAGEEQSNGGDHNIPAHTSSKLHCGGGSGESSPTCVIQNSALRSNSSSPTMSTISKASSDPGRKSHEGSEGRSLKSGSTRKSTRAATSPEHEEQSVAKSEPPKTGDLVRGRIKHLGNNNTSGRPGLKGAGVRRMESDSSCAKENEWTTIPHESVTSRGGGKEAQTPPFKSIQCAVADKTSEEGVKHKKIPASSRPCSQSASIMHKSPGIFSFNATYMSSRADSESFDDFDHHHQISFDSPKEMNLSSRRSFLTPLLKPTPSKWDDAEKWLSGSHSDATLNPARAKARSGPLLAQMVATQAGMSKGHGILFGQQQPASKTLTTSSNANPKLVIDFTPDEKEQLNLLLGRYSVERITSEGDTLSDGSLSPSCLNGSFMKLCSRMEKPSVNSSPETRDMGTAMTPIPSLEPSRIGTPLRPTTSDSPPPPPSLPEKEETKLEGSCDHEATTDSKLAMTEKEFQEKTRQEIVMLGTQLGKANIAAAWATKDVTKESAIIRRSSKSALDLENLRRDVFASRADAWREAEKAKYTSRFQHEEANIKAWEELEKAKAEAEMRRVEAKAERMKAQAHEKLTNKLEGARRQAEEFRVAAEARRSEAVAKATRKAELMKTHGKLTNLLFSSLLCT